MVEFLRTDHAIPFSFTAYASTVRLYHKEEQVKSSSFCRPGLKGNVHVCINKWGYVIRSCIVQFITCSSVVIYHFLIPIPTISQDKSEKTQMARC